MIQHKHSYRFFGRGKLVNGYVFECEKCYTRHYIPVWYFWKGWG